MTCDDDCDPEEAVENRVIRKSSKENRPRYCNITEAKNGYIVRLEMNSMSFDESQYVFDSLVSAMEFVTDYFAEVK